MPLITIRATKAQMSLASENAKARGFDRGPFMLGLALGTIEQDPDLRPKIATPPESAQDRRRREIEQRRPVPQ